MVEMVSFNFIIICVGDYQVKVEFDEEYVFIEKIDWVKGLVKCERIKRVNECEIDDKTKIFG